MTSVPTRRPKVVAMVHVHSTTAILDHAYTPLLRIDSPTADELSSLRNIVASLRDKLAAYTDPLVEQVTPKACIRSVVLLLGSTSAEESAFAALPFVAKLVARAVDEVGIYARHGIEHVEVENVGAPYFLGSGQCPWEELLMLNEVTKAIRAHFSTLSLGCHVLSCDELEALPIAIRHGCFFVRSEATLFQGMRPEGVTDNRSNMARFLYLRSVFRKSAVLYPNASSATTMVCQHHQHLPMIWSDVKKKHTHFSAELQDIGAWLGNITFCKLEGVIVTGLETGSDVDEESLRQARAAIDKVKQWNESQFAAGGALLPPIPLVTGSGLNFSMYARYADFMIVGTAFKKGGYWENEVDEAKVVTVMAGLAA